MLIAVDTGGTKTLVGRFSADGTLEASKRFPTPKSVPAYLDQLRMAINALAKTERISAISVGLPGTISLDGTMTWAANLPWHDINITTLLGKSYSCPIIVENDANLAGLGEARSLKTIPHTVLYVTVSTGIGTGLVTNGLLNPDFTRSEGGQIIIEFDGVLRKWESFASGSAIVARYGKMAKDIHDKRSWYQVGKNIARGLIVLSPVLRPDVVIIGGSVGTYFDNYSETVAGILKEYAHDNQVPQLIQAVHPEQAVLYGCYYHAHDTLSL